jgi:Tfp pilus assembly protein PilP
MAKWLAPLAAIFLLASPTTCGQTPEDLQQQLEQLKREYQQKLQELDKRLAALEKQSTSVPAPAQAALTKTPRKM